MPKDLDVLNPEQWRQLGIEDARALSGGHQSQVFSGRLDGRHVVAKLTNAELVDARQFSARIQMLGELVQLDSNVVAPIGLDDQPLRVAGWLVVVYPFVEGEPPDISQPADAALIGRTLATLHRSLASMPPIDVGQVAALQIATRPMPGSAPQLLHGDFSAANLRHNDGISSVFDFDDCGYGPPEFDVANSLYMELFEAVRSNQHARYAAFRKSFVDTYTSESGLGIDANTLDQLIGIRRDALSYWIQHLDQAPIGIRTSSPEWLQQLSGLINLM